MRDHQFARLGRSLNSPTFSGKVNHLNWVLPLVKLNLRKYFARWSSASCKVDNLNLKKYFPRWSSASCDCPPDCSFTTYSVTPSSSPLRSTFLLNSDTTSFFLGRPCDSRNLALSPLCHLEGLQSLPWLEGAMEAYVSAGAEIPAFLSEMEGRLRNCFLWKSKIVFWLLKLTNS